MKRWFILFFAAVFFIRSIYGLITAIILAKRGEALRAKVFGIYELRRPIFFSSFVSVLYVVKGVEYRGKVKASRKDTEFAMNNGEIEIVSIRERPSIICTAEAAAKRAGNYIELIVSILLLALGVFGVLSK